MKNSATVVLSLTMVLLVAMGCSLGGLTGGGSDSETSKESTKKSGDSTETTEKAPSGEKIEIGIKECDELATYINDNSEELEGNLITRGIMLYVKNKVLGDLKESVAKMNDEEKAKSADACKKALTQLKDSMK